MRASRQDASSSNARLLVQLRRYDQVAGMQDALFRDGLLSAEEGVTRGNAMLRAAI